MQNIIRKAKLQEIPQIVDLLIDEIDYVYDKIFPGTSFQKRKTLLTKMLGLVDKSNFLEYRRFFVATDEKQKIIGITGLITTEKVSFIDSVNFFLKVIFTLLRSLSIIQFFKFLLSLYKNRDLFTSDIKSAGYITYIIVNKRNQKKGLGSHLLSYSLDYFKKRGYKEISLVVRSENRVALNLFKKNGFKEVLRKKDRFISFGEKVIMSREI